MVQRFVVKMHFLPSSLSLFPSALPLLMSWPSSREFPLLTSSNCWSIDSRKSAILIWGDWEKASLYGGMDFHFFISLEKPYNIVGLKKIQWPRAESEMLDWRLAASRYVGSSNRSPVWDFFGLRSESCVRQCGKKLRHLFWTVQLSTRHTNRGQDRSLSWGTTGGWRKEGCTADWRRFRVCYSAQSVGGEWVFTVGDVLSSHDSTTAPAGRTAPFLFLWAEDCQDGLIKYCL